MNEPKANLNPETSLSAGAPSVTPPPAPPTLEPPASWGELHRKAEALEEEVKRLKEALRRSAEETEKQRQWVERTLKGMEGVKAEASKVKEKALAHANKTTTEFRDKNKEIADLKALIEKTGVKVYTNGGGAPNEKVPSPYREKPDWIGALIERVKSVKEIKDDMPLTKVHELHADLTKPMPNKACQCPVCRTRRVLDATTEESQKMLSQLDVQKRTIERYEHRLNPAKKK